MPSLWLGLVGALLALGSPAAVQPAAAATGLAVVLGTSLAPWERLPSALQLLTAYAAVAMLVPVELLAPRAWDMHDGIVVVLPLLWLAAERGRPAVVGGLALVAAVCLAPTLEGSRPGTFDALLVVVVVAAALLVNRLAARAAAAAADLARVHTDTVTGLPNRAAWDGALESLLAAASRRRTAVTVVLMDLDGFADFNDDWGHAAGDRLLASTAGHIARESECVSMIARTGADEFAAAILGSDVEAARNLVRRVRQQFEHSGDIAAGIVVSTREEPVSTVMSRAAAALRRAAADGAGSTERIVVGEGSQGGPGWHETLPRLIAAEQIEAVYQPIVSLASGGAVAYEALARPLGASPSLTVDGMFAEARRQGLAWELEMLCLRAAVRGALPLAADIDLFVNIGPGGLRDPDALVTLLHELLAETRRRPETVVLEISETVTRLARFRPALAALRRVGLRFALDDAGEASSSLQSLAAVEPEYIKLARSMVAGAPADRVMAAAVRAVAEFGKATGATIIAEGVETPTERDTVAALGATLAQGFAFGRPARLPAATRVVVG